MGNESYIKEIKFLKECALIGIAIIFLLGSFWHFFYALSGESLIIGLIAPVNESVWEHLKLAFFPTIIWWVFCYICSYKKNNISITQWIISAMSASLISPLFILSFYYIYTGIFGIHSILLDILSLFIGIAIAQVKAIHIYKNPKSKIHFYLTVGVFVIIFMCFVIFTFNAPHLPLFHDALTGNYGISV